MDEKLGSTLKAEGLKNPSAKKKKLSEKKSKASPLFTLADISGKFPHLSETIFNEVDDQSLVKCREVSEIWKTTLGNQKTFWRRYRTRARLGRGLYIFYVFFIAA